MILVANEEALLRSSPFRLLCVIQSIFDRSFAPDKFPSVAPLGLKRSACCLGSSGACPAKLSYSVVLDAAFFNFSNSVADFDGCPVGEG